MCTRCYGTVSLGVTVARPRAMLAACLGGATGGAIVGFAGTHCTSFAFPSFITCVAFAGQGFALFLFSTIAGFGVLHSYLLYYRKNGLLNSYTIMNLS